MKLHSWFLQSSQIPLFGSTSFGQSEVQVEKNHKNTSTFHTSLSCPRGIELSQSILNRKGTFYYLNSKSKLWLCYGDNGLPTKCWMSTVVWFMFENKLKNFSWNELILMVPEKWNKSSNLKVCVRVLPQKRTMKIHENKIDQCIDQQNCDICDGVYYFAIFHFWSFSVVTLPIKSNSEVSKMFRRLDIIQNRLNLK